MIYDTRVKTMSVLEFNFKSKYNLCNRQNIILFAHKTADITSEEKNEIKIKLCEFHSKTRTTINGFGWVHKVRRVFEKDYFVAHN
jgi:hypothetical protein